MLLIKSQKDRSRILKLYNLIIIFNLDYNDLKSFMKKILIANRGEIALRIMRSVREMGIKTVAIFSEADRNALFVRYADEAVCIGPPPSSQSYLQGDKIIEISKQLGVDGIHPGYGFLSENADFARKVKAAGITFIGPSAESMDMMGAASITLNKNGTITKSRNSFTYSQIHLLFNLILFFY